MSAAAIAADSKRYEKSLGLLTMRFVSLLRKAKDGILDLKHASNLLAVTQKRRIYDITNVLEGIGLIAKKSKNSVQWKGSLSESHNKNMSKKVKNLRRQLNRLNAHECMLDQQIRWITQSTKNVLDEQTNQDLLYVVQNDVRQLFTTSDQVVVLEASLGTGLSIHVPTPENYTLHVKSRNAVDVVLLCDAEDEKQKEKEMDESADKEVELFMNAYEDKMLKNRLCRLSPPVTKMDFIFSLNNSEGLCDLFDIPC